MLKAVRQSVTVSGSGGPHQHPRQDLRRGQSNQPQEEVNIEEARRIESSESLPPSFLRVPERALA